VLHPNYIKIPSQVIGQCLYCPSTDGLTTEHVIPESLGGTLLLDSASCEPCRKRTHAIETEATSKMLGALRHGRKFRSKKGRGRKQWVSLERADGTIFGAQVEADDLPKFSWAMQEYTTTAPVLMAQAEREKYTNIRSRSRVRVSDNDEELNKIRNKYGGEYQRYVNPEPFAQMLAKIAHGLVVASYGVDSFVPFLPEHILMSPSDGMIHDYIGTPFSMRLPVHPSDVVSYDFPENPVIAATGIRTDGIILCNIQVLPNLGMPDYGIVVGKILAD
jgi:hypothetical protein